MSEPTAPSPVSTAHIAAPVVDDVESLRDDIFNSNDITSEIVTIKEWNRRSLEVRAMTGDERAIYLAQLQENAPGGDMTKIDWKTFYPTLLAATVFSPARDPQSGEFVLGVSQTKVFRPDDVDRLNKKSSKAIEKLAKKARALSGMLDDEEDADDEASA